MAEMTGDSTAGERLCAREPIALTAGAERAHGTSRSQMLLLIVFMAVWYGFWLWVSAAPALPRPALDFTFNSMLTHLLHGQFDVDPQAIGNEGYLRNGHVFAYWGIWGALLRLPLWVAGRMDFDMTVWSCLAAVLIASVAKLRLLIRLRSLGEGNRITRHAGDLMLAYILLGGSDAGYLRANIFQEVVLWGYAFSTIFVCFAITGLIQRRFTLGALSTMALCAGLAILTRVSFGMGLSLAFGLLLLVLIVGAGSGAPDRPAVFERCSRALRSRRILMPLGILAMCIAVAATVNYMRWGNPLTFVDYRLYLGNKLWPDRVPREAAYGLFSLGRIPFGVVYYFFPAWAIHGADGHLLFGQTQVRLFDMVELPPGSFFLTDLLPLCFIGFALVALVRFRRSFPSRAQSAAIAAGLLAPCLLMLSFVAMAYRYRMEFYPEIDFLSFLGLWLILSDDGMQARFARARKWMTMALVVSVLGTFAMLILYLQAPYGPAQYLLERGVQHSMTDR